MEIKVDNYFCLNLFRLYTALLKKYMKFQYYWLSTGCPNYSVFENSSTRSKYSKRSPSIEYSNTRIENPTFYEINIFLLAFSSYSYFWHILTIDKYSINQKFEEFLSVFMYFEVFGSTLALLIWQYFEESKYFEILRETRKNMHGGQIFFCRVGLLYIHQNLARDVNFQDLLSKFQYLSCT